VTRKEAAGAVADDHPLAMGAIGRAGDPGPPAPEVEDEVGALAPQRGGADRQRLRGAQPQRQVDQVRARIEQGVVAAAVGAPGAAPVAELEVKLDPPLGRNPAGQLGSLEEAPVEGDPGRRLECGQLEGARAVGGDGLLDQGRHPRGRGGGGDGDVLGGRRRHQQRGRARGTAELSG
jgi:hypothetical protein